MKFKYILIFSFLLIFLVSSTAPVFANCFTEMNFNPNNNIDGSSELTLLVTNSEYPLVVEVHTSGYMGNSKKMCYNVAQNDDLNLHLWGAVNTLPIYITCHKADISHSNTQDGCWGKLGVLDWVSIYPAEKDAPLGPFENTLEPKSIVDTTVSINDVNITKAYDVLDSDTVYAKWLFGFLFIFIGAFVLFKTYFKKGWEYI